MDHSDHCAELLLDYLYDLLDEAEVDRVRAHLDLCPACRAQLAQAESQQRLFARAARLYQNVPAFVPPDPVQAGSASADTMALHHETVVEQPVAVPPAAPRPARSAARLAGWLSLAAAVLLAVGLGT